MRPDAQLPREAVARARRNDPERHVAEDQPRRDFIDRAVTAPRHHQIRATRDGGPGQLLRVPASFGDEDLRRVAVAIDDRRSHFRAIARRVRPDSSGDRIDDERDQKATLGQAAKRCRLRWP